MLQQRLPRSTGGPLGLSPPKRRLCLAAVFAVGVLFAPVQPGTAGTASPDQTSQSTPPNQPALDAAADDAEVIARDYFTSAVVDDQANTVTMTLNNAPQAVIDQINNAHPGVYVIKNDGAFSWNYLLALQDKMNQHIDALATEGAAITQFGPTTDGHLAVQVQANPATALSVLNSLYGSGPFRVTQDSSPPGLAIATRYNDFAPWNVGDFVYHKTSTANWSDCTGGVPVENNTTLVNYFITAAHCFRGWGPGISVLNGYVRKDNDQVYSGSAATVMGNISRMSDVLNNVTDDVALVNADSSYLVFKGDWNTQTTYPMAGLVVNKIGDIVCASGAFDPTACDIKIGGLNVTRIIDVGYKGWGPYSIKVQHQDYGSTTGTNVAAGSGDSGGAVYTNENGTLKARGMMDSIGTEQACGNNPPGFVVGDRFCSQTLFFTGMSWIEQDFNVSVGG